MNKSTLQISSFIIGQKQIDLDLQILSFDVWATVVHVLMLYKQNIIGRKNLKKILQALTEIEQEVLDGKFFIDPMKGAQLTLEAKIVEKTGDAGYSVHTGRSRNDQITVAELLYLREKVLNIIIQSLTVCEELILIAKKNKQTIMPGYTHMQPAKPTTVGQWALSYCNGILRGTETLKYYFEKYNMNPLGACESYGTSWPLNREYTAKLLGFNSVWELPQDAISSRGLTQYGYLNGLTEITLFISKITQDLLLFSTFEFGMIELGDEVAQRMHPITGSSVMAQKKNPDVLELMRATAPQITGITAIVANILVCLPMGYNRDVREIKEYIEIGFTKTSSILTTMKNVLKTVSWNEKKMEKLVTENYSLTTDLADYISQRTGIGYRIIYKIIGQIIDEAIITHKPLQKISAEEIIQKAKTFNLDLQLTNQELQTAINLKSVIEKRNHIGGSSKKTMDTAIKNTKKEIEKLHLWQIQQKKSILNASKKTHDLIKKFLKNL